MKRLLVTLFLLVFAVGVAKAQGGFLNKIVRTATNTAENAVQSNVNRRVYKAVNNAVDKAADNIEGSIRNKRIENNAAKSEKKSQKEAKANAKPQEEAEAASISMEEANANLEFDDWDMEEEDISMMNGTSTGAVSGSAKAGKTAAASSSSAQTQAKPQNARATTKYNKFDFVAGDEIIFEDNLAGEQLGEFPSQWDLLKGVAEVAQVDGQNVIALEPNGHIRPFMDPILNYLGDVFTIEFDYYQQLEQEGEGYGTIYLYLYEKDKNSIDDRSLSLSFDDYYQARYYHKDGYETYNTTKFSYNWKSTNDDNLSGENNSLDLGVNNWVHVSLSFNKRALKIYINETRIANVPNMTNKSGWLAIERSHGTDGYPSYIRNVRIAKGAVPLYDRMMSDGKFITYGITFDVGKSTIKDESMGEINRIVKLMTDNADLKFSVEGHTDNTGSAANNQQLSEERSKAIVDKLVELGIDSSRLSSSGKGQNSPIADNGTEEGRAKNRRVEFVKQ